MDVPAAADEIRPLAGVRVLVTRAEHQASDLVGPLAGLGAEVVAIPTIRIDEPTDPRPVRDACRMLERFDWIIFTSANGVARFWSALRSAGRDLDAVADLRICAIGEGTAAAVEAEGGRVDLVPDEFVAESIFEALAATTELRGRRLLLPRAESAREVLPRLLSGAGAEVTDVAVYRTVPNRDVREMLVDLVSNGSVDVVTFTSGSTARSFVEMVGSDLGSMQVASIGPITSQVIRQLGLPVTIEADVHTVEGLVTAIRQFFTEDG